MLFVWLDLVPVANVAKIVAAGALGFWLAGELEQLSWIVVVAAVAAVGGHLQRGRRAHAHLLTKGPRSSATSPWP